MKRIIAVLVLSLMWAVAAPGEGSEVVYRDYGGQISVQADTEYVDLGKLKVEKFDTFERFLNELPNVSRVDMYATHVFRKQAERLSEQYPHIDFGWSLYFGDHIVRTDQMVFSTRHDSIMKRHSTEDMEVLRYCKNLHALDLGHNDLTDISFLSGLSELRLLILADNRIEDIAPLSGLKKLEYIELFDNRITDLKPLVGLSRLMDLNIAQNRVEDIAPLGQMPCLRRLWMGACSVLGEDALLEELASLCEALPDTQIDAFSLGTEGGWRDHSHYDILFRMFKGKDYFPFEDSNVAGERF